MKPNRVVLVTVGTSPAVVTETLYALHQRDINSVSGEQPERTELLMLTTTTGQEEISTQLIRTGAFSKLCEEVGISHLREVTEDCIINFDHIEGQPVTDIRSADDVIAMSDKICEIVGDWSGQPDWSIHASLAGGRKPMSMQLGFAMMMLGRAGDELSHVLTNPERPNEFCEKPFLYPSSDNPGSEKIDVVLVEVPTLLLEGQPLPELGSGPGSYRNLLANLQARLVPAITFDLPGGAIEIGNHRIGLSPSWLALYAWAYLKHKRGSEVSMPPNFGDFIKILKKRDTDGLASHGNDDFDATVRYAEAIRAGREYELIYSQIRNARARLSRLYPFPQLQHSPRLQNFPCLTSQLFAESIANVRGKIEEALGSEAYAEPYIVKRSEDDTYTPRVAPDKIQFIWTDEEVGNELLA